MSIVILFILGLASVSAFDLLGLKTPLKSSGGGLGCIGCTLGLTIVEQLSLIHNKTVGKILEEVCELFPPTAKQTCVYYVDNYAAEIIFLFELGLSPDGVCHGLNFCTDPTCHLWPTRNDIKIPPKFLFEHPKPHFDPWAWLKALIDRLGQKHEPIIDLDGDRFSLEPELRGSGWRGRDCNEFDKTVYPGRRANQYSPDVDHDCNGIKRKNGIDYEAKFCSNSGQIGCVVVGDSAGAHFHIPGEWLNASAIDAHTYSDLLFALSMELDWPHLSAWTGYVPSTPAVPTNSIYNRMRTRNLCNHRDYQNIAVNGMRSRPSAELVQSIARNQTTDRPVLMLFELIGNDVCSPRHSTDYTTVKDFKNNILATLSVLDTILPKGSHVLFMGLARGSILWDTMHARTHPIGTNYANVYAYLNCLESNPCWTWLNSNQTVRDLGDQRAAELSLVYPDIVANYSYKNFDMDYTPFPLVEIMKMWAARGGEMWQLIEPVDGFHPNQQFNALLAEYLWDLLEKKHPDWLGAENPFNAQIISIFGDQNGH